MVNLDAESDPNSDPDPEAPVEVVVAPEIEQLETICSLSRKRALELWEASSGSLDRAIGIHFDTSANITTTNVSTTTSSSVHPLTGQQEQQSSQQLLSPSDQKKQQQQQQQQQQLQNKKRKIFASQGTLNSFFGVSGSTKQRQLKIESCFNHRNNNQNNDSNDSNNRHNNNNSNGNLPSETGEDIKAVDLNNTKISASNYDSGIVDVVDLVDDDDDENDNDNTPNKTSIQSHTTNMKIDDNNHNEKKPQQNRPKFKKENYKSQDIKENQAGEKKPNEEDIDCRLYYSCLAQCFEEMTNTTKRNLKLSILRKLFKNVILALGGIPTPFCIDDGDTTTTTTKKVEYSDNSSYPPKESRSQDGLHVTRNMKRKNDHHILTMCLELVLGKISSSSSSSTPESETKSSEVLLVEDITVSPMALQISGSTVSQAVRTITNVSKKQMSPIYRRTGDLGDVAAELISTQQNQQKRFFNTLATKKSMKRQPLTILQVHQSLSSIASLKGKGSQKQKQNMIVQLLRKSMSKEETRFLVRILIGNMRLGATIKSVLAALTMATVSIEKSNQIHNNHNSDSSEQQCNSQSNHDNDGNNDEDVTTLNSAAEEIISSPKEFQSTIEIMQKTHDICPRLNIIAEAILKGGMACVVQTCTLQVGVPIHPMLANAAHSLAEVEKLMTIKNTDTIDENKIKKYNNKNNDNNKCQDKNDINLQKEEKVIIEESNSDKAIDNNTSTSAVAEYKYDGIRCQAHAWSDNSEDGKIKVRLFSRHLLDQTHSYPDAVSYLMSARKSDQNVKSFIIDAEIVAVMTVPLVNKNTQKTLCNEEMGDNDKHKEDAVEDEEEELRLLPFQVLSTRRGNSNINTNDKSNGENFAASKPLSSSSSNLKSTSSHQVRIRIYAFDLMYLNGVSMLNRPLWERRQIMEQHFRVTKDFAFASSITLPKFDENIIRKYLTKAVQDGAEGLMIKLNGKTNSQQCSSFKSKIIQTNTSTTTPPKIEKNGQSDDDTNHNNLHASPSSISSSLLVQGFNGDSSSSACATLCPYESGTRSKTWLKLKRDYVEGYADTIDVVPIGAWYGNGRKATKQFLSPVLFAVYDEEDGVFRSISRCLSFTDEMYIAMREFYLRGIPYPTSPSNLGTEETAITPGINSTEKNKDGSDNKNIKGVDNIDAVEEDSNNDDDDVDNDNKKNHNTKDKNCTNGSSTNKIKSEAAIICDGDSGGGDDDDDDCVDNFVNCFPSRPPSSVVITNESPSIWFKPMEVFEVSFADLTLSRTHTAGAGLVDLAEGRGVSLRFPRFKRRRPDKTIEQATTTTQIAQMFFKQSKQN